MLSKIKILISALAIVMIVVSVPVFATGEYTVLAPLPGTTSCGQNPNANMNCTTEINSYLRGIFNLSISIGAVLAFVMITFGGIQYATSDAVSGKSQGRETVTNAVWGLILIIGAWVILNTINPEILKFNLNVENVSSGTFTVGNTGGIGTGGGIAMTPEQIANDALNRSRLASAGIQINNAEPCKLQGQTQGCTSVNGLPEPAIQGLDKLKQQCQCAITITGGTESGHQTHGVNIPIVDLAPFSVGTWFSARVSDPLTPTNITLADGRVIRVVYETAGGNPNGTSTGNHWHVQFL